VGVRGVHDIDGFIVKPNLFTDTKEGVGRQIVRDFSDLSQFRECVFMSDDGSAL